MHVSHLTIRRYHCGNPFTNILHPMRHSTLLAILALLASVTAIRAQPADSLLLQAKQMLRVGESEGKSDKIQQARATFERATADESLATLAHYYAAYAAHQLVDLLTGSNPDIPKRELLVHIDYAIHHLEESTQRDPSFAEGWALLASVYGRKISLKPLLGMTLGQKSRRAQRTAVEIAPDNPRVVLLKAIGDFNTPRMWGGSKKRAIEGLRRAATLFQEESVSNPLQPSWGHSDVYAWLGIAHLDEDNLSEARKAFEKALTIDPEFGWVKYDLMPSLERREGAEPY